MLKIQPIHSKSIWQTFLEKKYAGFTPFFQTWNWGDVQKKLGFSVVRFGLYENEQLVGVFQVIAVFAKRGRYLHLRHGPVFLSQKRKYYKKTIAFLKKIAKQEECFFIRMSPLLEETEKIKELFHELGLRDAPIHRMDAEVCWVLPLEKSDEEILKNMRKSHRYLIKKAMSIALTIEKSTAMNASFFDLYKRLAKRKHFIAHTGVAEELSYFAKDNQALLFLAKFEGKVIAGALIDFVGNTAIYRHSASDDAYKDIPAMYLLQWEVIQEAKQRKMQYYNFWGIAPDNNKRHPWNGLTLFKTGFGGEKMTFAHTKDLPLTFWYWKSYAIDMLTKLKKGY